MLKQEFVPVDGKRRMGPIVIIIASFLVGWFLMVIIAVFEDDLKFDLGDSC
jgi:hypothetical protein